MKPSIALLRGALAGPVSAAAPTSRSATSPMLPDKGHVLLLDNDELLEGDIERVGERYRVRQGTGEMSIPAARVTGLVADRDAAFQVLKQRLKPNDANEHLRLARWCLSHQLPQRAIEEADVAAKINTEPRFRVVNCEPIKRQAAVMHSGASAAKATAQAAMPAAKTQDAATVDVS